MKHFLATLLIIFVAVPAIKAQKVVLHMVGNQTAEYSTSQLDSIKFSIQKLFLHLSNKQVAEYSTAQLDSITFLEDGSSGGGDTTEPSVTGDAFDITNWSAKLVGYATNIRDNLSTDLRVGFIYCLDGTPNKNNGTQVDVPVEEVAEDGRYIATLTNLLSNTIYYFRSFVYQSGLWFYGKVKSFMTNNIEVELNTGNATAITCFSAKASGSVSVQSPYTTLECGICYGTNIEPTIYDNKVNATSDNFTLQLRKLYGNTIYYYRTYAIVDGQAYYGTVRTFRTLVDNVVETGTIDEETLKVTSKLTLGGGAYSSLVLGVCYGKTELPTILDRTVTSDEVDEENNYTVKLSISSSSSNPGYEPWGGLNVDNYGTIYYRAYILIDGIPHYGAVKSFEWIDEDYINSLDALRYGAYRQMAQTASKFALWGDLRSDSYMINSVSNSAQTSRDIYIEIMAGMLDTCMNVFDWGGVYTTINYCNKVLKYKNQLSSNESGSQIVAEMTALRALNYFYLIRAFKDVPYTTKAMNKDSDLLPPLTNQLVVLDSIIADCESVKGKARNRFTRKEDSKGMITNCAIYAMLADMYLWRGSLHEGRHGKIGIDIVNGEEIGHNVDDDYNKAVEYADSCLQSLANRNAEERANAGPNTTAEETFSYGLNNCEMIKNNFEGAAQATTPKLEAQLAIFNEKNSCESIFELQYSVSDGLQNTFVNSLYGFGNGTHLMVNKDAMDALYDGGIDGTGNNGGMWDSRLWVGCQNKLTTSSQSPDVQPLSNYYCMKYQFDNLNMSGTGARREIKSLNYYSSKYNNWIIYRMTDVMLIKAEALACLGSSNANMVHAICNAIHRRSYCNFRNPSKIPNTNAMMEGYYGNAFGSMKKASNGIVISDRLACVMNERQIELLGEGKRWFDLVRMAERSSYVKTDPDDPREPGVPNGQSGMSAMVELFLGSGSNASYATTLTNRFKNRYGLYCPIYYLEVRASNGAIEQNPVWNKSKYE